LRLSPRLAVAQHGVEGGEQSVNHNRALKAFNERADARGALFMGHSPYRSWK
jgi:hypothetical protein